MLRSNDEQKGRLRELEKTRAEKLQIGTYNRIEATPTSIMSTLYSKIDTLVNFKQSLVIYFLE